MSFREERIGGQRLILGDAMQIVPTLGMIDSIVTDAPYGMDFRSNHRKEKHGFIAMDKDCFAMEWCANLGAAHSKYMWMRWDNLQTIPRPTSLITWVKNNWSMGDLDHEHGRQTEVCAFYRGPDHAWPGKRPADVIFCPRTGNEFHPTEKPVPLMEVVVGWTVGTVLDCFMGSGSTLVACERMGRHGIGIEMDPAHFETACRRVEDARRRPSMFIDPTPKPEQINLFGGGE